MHLKVNGKKQAENGNVSNEVVPAAAMQPARDGICATATNSFASDLPHFVNTIPETAFVLKCSEKSVRRLIDRNLLSA
jgi:hypothetical protein